MEAMSFNLPSPYPNQLPGGEKVPQEKLEALTATEQHTV